MERATEREKISRVFVLTRVISMRLRLMSRKSLADERKLAQPLSIECEHGVCDRWRNWWNTGFPKAAGIIATRHEIDFNLRHVTHAEHLISVEIGLLNRAVLDRNRAVKGCAQAIGDSAFTLRFSAVRIDDHAAI